MILGKLPHQCLRQMLDLVDFNEWKGVVVACSGAFSIEQAIKKTYPDLPVLSSDISVLTVALGSYMVGEPIEFRFRSELAWLEKAAGRHPEDRLAAMLLASEMVKYRQHTLYDDAHIRYYRKNTSKLLSKAQEKLQKFLTWPRINEFEARDIWDIPLLAKERGWGVCSFPPTDEGGYGFWFKFMDKNVEWEHPKHTDWKPENLPTWVAALPEQHVVFGDTTENMPEPAASHAPRQRRTIYLFTNTEKSRYQQDRITYEPFHYDPIVPAELTLDTRVEIAPLTTGQFNFLRSVFLAKDVNITIIDAMWRYAVLLDGKLAGAFGYYYSFMVSRRYDDALLYLLSDLSVVRGNRISKLIALLSTSYDILQPLEVQRLTPVTILRTTAFTQKATSMKYRGVFEVENRGKDSRASERGFVNYVSPVRQQGVQELYTHWFNRWFKPKRNPRNQNHKARPKRAEAV